jgi:aspartyl-tRNA(Asn)/glutamyl-tRNA(Gln) amidotransferase subunit A
MSMSVTSVNLTNSAISATSLSELTVHEALILFRRKEISPVDLVQDCFARIERFNPTVNALCHVDREGALSVARAAEARWCTGSPAGALDGIPVTIKDLTLTLGMPTRRGSATSSADGPWDVDAPLAGRMREAGAVILGKTTSPEFGWKGVTDNPLHGITRNPWDTSLTPGGSSGGAGVAAALNLGLLHQGSDAGGSIRIPASFTGTFGFKPTFGYVPQWPASAMASLSHLGPMTRTVADAEMMMQVITEPDSRDGYAGPRYPTGTPKQLESLAGWRIAYSRDLGYVNVDPGIAAVVDAAVDKCRSLGADVVNIDPGFCDPIAIFDTLWHAGAARILRDLTLEQQALLDPGFREIAEKGMSISLAQYMQAGEQRYDLTAQMAAFHDDFDLLVTPTMPIAPFDAGINTPASGGYANWTAWTQFSYPFNLTQQPAASLPCGLDAQGLPVGLHLIARRYNDHAVLSAARLLEGELGRLKPPGYKL